MKRRSSPTGAGMLIILSFLSVLGGIGLYFFLLSLGVYRLYPIETYFLIAAGVALAWIAFRREGGWWRVVILGTHAAMLALFLLYTLRLTRLPEVELPVAVGQELPRFSLPDQDGGTFDTSDLRGKSRALFVFYRGDW